MKTKTSNLLFVSIFAFVFLIGIASAAITLTSSVTTLSQSGGSFNLTVSSTENETIDLDISPVSDGSGKSIIFSLSPSQVILNTAEDASAIVNISYVVESGFDFEFGKAYNVLLTAVGSVSNEVTKTFKFEDSDFCEYGNPGSLRVTIKDIQVTEGFGEDKDWFAFDKVEVEIEVKNTGSEDIEDVVIEWGLYNTQSGEWTIEVDEEDELDIDEGDKEIITITFNLDDSLDEGLEDLEEGDYIIYIRATGEVADGTYEGENTCSSDSDTGKLTLEKNFVVLSNLKAPEISQCGSEVHISGDVWNIGSKDQNDVYIEIYNSELNIEEKIEVGDIDSFENTDFDFILNLPEDAQEKRYSLTLTVYDEDDDVYESGNNDESIFRLGFDVQGGCSVAKASVIAVLESGGQAGKEMVVKATIKNTGKKTAYYSLNLAGYSEWASSATLDKNSLTLNTGESGDVLLKLDVKKDAVGTNLFNLEVLSGNELVVSQPVQVEITKRKWGITGGLFSGENKYIWGIGLLNLILIILIIVVAIRIARK